MSQELTYRLAVAAGWMYVNNFGADLWHKGQDALSYAHPFPIGRIDPILDLMREMGLSISGIFTPSSGIPEWDVFIKGHKGRGPDLWTALASAVLAALEKNA